MKPIRYFSMFSGIGGFELGIEQSGVEMECIGFSEVDKYATSIYTRQFPEHKGYGDATKIDPKELPDFDFLVGGFPCQAFSLAGKRKGFDDTRGTLFFEIARVLKKKRPRYFLLENVKGLLSHDKGQTFQTILGVLSELGYDVEWEVLNSKDFGVPQNRERIFIKGYFRAKCGGEILSAKRDSREVISEMIWSWTSTRVGKFVDPEGLGLTLCSAGHNSSHNQLIKQDIKLPVTKRKYNVDIDGLQNILRECKENKGLSISDISERLELPQTQVEHWFRTDKYFSIPPKEIWFVLKDVLGITTDEFDESITTFEVVDGVYDMSNRCYDVDGISPTITNDGNKLIKLNDKAQAQTIYDSDGLATTLSANGGGQGGKTGLYKVDSKEFDLLSGASDGNVACLDANYHKGIGPSDVKKNRRRRTHVIETKDEPKFVRMHGSNQEHRMISDKLCCALNNHRTPMVEFDKSLKIRTATKKGYDEAEPHDGIRFDHPEGKTGRGRVQKESTGALSCGSNWGTVDKDYRIRRLTPKECERLQGFPDDWTKYGKDGELISDTQRYKCCGNAVTVNVIEFLIRSMFG